jgi:hypothetical protein
MFKFFGRNEKTKFDVIMAAAAALIAAWKAVDTFKEYQIDNQNKELNA